MTGPARSVLFVTHPFGWGGTEKHLEDLILRTPPDLCDLKILAFAPDSYADALAKRGRTDVRVFQEQASTFRDYRRIFGSLRSTTIVFVNGKLGLFPWVAYAAARTTGARVIGIEHLLAEKPPSEVSGGGPTGALRRALGWRARHMFNIRAAGRLSHRTVCVSNAVRQALITNYGYPPGRTVTVLNGIDVNYYRRGNRAEARRALGLGTDRSVLCCIARLGTLKRIDILLRSVATLASRYPSLTCTIVGGGPLQEELQQQAASLGLSDVVVFAGHQEDVRCYLDAADVYVSSSEREGFGLALVEAMAHELPSVATNIGGHDEVLQRPGTGILVPPGSPEALAQSTAYLLDHPEEARIMGLAARKAAEERFDINRMVTQLLDIILDRV